MWMHSPFPVTSQHNQQETAPAWMEGLQRFRKHSLVRHTPDYPVIWQHRQVRCLSVTVPHGRKPSPNAPAVLFIPSLINRYYILDLTEELSLLRNIAAQGFHVYVVDWAEPSPQDSECNASDYISHYLRPLAHFLHQHHQRRIITAGYCIGGLMSLALALLEPEIISRIALLATPWDFHTETTGVWGVQATVTEAWCKSAPLVPGAYLSWLFYLADPQRCAEKYRYFATLDEQSEDYRRFIAVEHWVNDTTPLTRGFARDCLIGWAACNQTAQLGWRVGQRLINPAELACPALVVAPQYDRIVPKDSALALADAIPHTHTITPQTGHIGMIIGRKRHQELWVPLVEWLQEH